jgi:hypothetical protein
MGTWPSIGYPPAVLSLSQGLFPGSHVSLFAIDFSVVTREISMVILHF